MNQQLNGALIQNSNTINYQTYPNNQSSIVTTQLRTNFNNQKSSVQINMQPLIKPVQPLIRNQPIQPVAPIVYSFAQSDYTTNKLLTSNAKNKKISWTNDNVLDNDDDDFGNILGYVFNFDNVDSD